MKRIIRFFVVCLALSALQTSLVYAADNVRGGQKRDTTKTISTTVNSRSVSATQKSDTKKSEISRTTAKKVASAKTNEKKSVSARSDSGNTKTTVKQRSTKKVATQTNNRTTTNTRTATVTTRSAKNINSPIKTVSTRNAVYSRASKKNLTRAGEIDTEKVANIKSKDYSKCKTVFYECMDEFCANKDANLRRCACSSRVNEFDKIKKQLESAEDKMLDFNQKLLVVNLDKEDAAAINIATEGELAAAKKDSSESEKLLQKITDALNSSGDSKINNNLSSVALSLDTDSAWDSVDSLSGVATTSKNGVELYNAALPVCLEMAHEVCSDEELDIAQSGYKLTIQQDCNTVAKSYNSQYNNAMNKIHESSALLDMARLNNYQQRNSDDTLTCKKKILDQLADESVCGAGLYKCLDTTGQYINPSTGEAFLSANLYELSNLLTVPSGEETWSKVGENDKFVSFLNSKKKFLEPATKQCEDMSDTIWKEFIDDALAQIKLAQNSKLEEIKTSCTKLITECKTNRTDTLAEFDSRALSTFSVITDTTVNALCSDVEEHCVALLNNSGGYNNKWQEGVTDIAATISYDKIIDSCTTIGKNCIIQQCNGTTGNFALCDEETSQPRRTILKQEACWNDVYSCVKQTTEATLNTISGGILGFYKNDSANFPNNFYKYTYGEEISELDRPYSKCMINKASGKYDPACLLTEQIWGNCEYNPNTQLTTNSTLITSDPNNYKQENKILAPVDTKTSNLMYWFATNTGTQNNDFSCNAYSCPVNYVLNNRGHCSLLTLTATNDCKTALTEDQNITVKKDMLNFCSSQTKDSYGNCCLGLQKNTTVGSEWEDGAAVNGICVPNTTYKIYKVQTATCESRNGFCENSNIDILTAYCVTTGAKPTMETPKESVPEIHCDGFWIIIGTSEKDKTFVRYFTPFTSATSGQTVETKGPQMFYNTGSGCGTNSEIITPTTLSPTENDIKNFLIEYIPIYPNML